MTEPVDAIKLLQDHRLVVKLLNFKQTCFQIKGNSLNW